MSSKMFQHRVNRKQTEQGKYKRQKSKRHNWFVNPVRHNSPTSGGYQARKEIHQCSPYSKFSANSSFTTLDLGHTRIDFNLGTPRSEISSHFPQSITAPVII